MYIDIDIDIDIHRYMHVLYIYIYIYIYIFTCKPYYTCIYHIDMHPEFFQDGAEAATDHVAIA